MGLALPVHRLHLPLLLLTALLVAGCQKQEPEQAVPEAPTVQVVEVQPRALELVKELPGRIEPLRVAEVRARVAGIVQKRLFQEGSDVKAGQVLFRIDPAPFDAALARAQGDLARADAAVAEAQATVKRYEPLVKVEAVSQQDFMAAQTALKTAESTRISARADVKSARLNLDYATVTAPIAGRIGRAQVTEGALVGHGEATAMATIQQIDTVYADFTQSVGDALQLRDALAEGKLKRDGTGRGAAISVTVDGTAKKRDGRLLFSDIAVDRSSGQLTMRGEFPNQDGTLLPGMYVRVTTGQGVEPQALLVPQRAVKFTSDGKAQVLIVGTGEKVQARQLRTGGMYGPEWHVLEGLEGGERVIVGGAVVNPGDQVQVGAPPKAKAK